ncbi:MAG: hypothetical protein DWG76_08040 [Chloroflexi bacterium]|nr:hypothetical protein [Chloroflexota bacterium]MQC27377.1 hypothetical protein [Chloroflexota bacterium]
MSKITNPELRKIIERNVAELNVAISSGIDKTAKTCMILSGSIAEALILERLSRDATVEAQAILVAQSLVQNKPSKPNDLLSWTLANLVEVAQNIPSPVLPSDSGPQIGQLRHWRNLVHPGREIKETASKRVNPTKQRAKNAVGFLEFIAHELNL